MAVADNVVVAVGMSYSLIQLHRVESIRFYHDCEIVASVFLFKVILCHLFSPTMTILGCEF